MAHHRDAAVGEIADGLRHMRAALDLDGAAAGLLQHPRRVAEGDRRAFLIGAERHVHDHERAGGTAHHGLRMHDHELERHRDGGLVAMHHHAEGVADEQHVDIGVDDAGGMRVIGGQRHDRRAALAFGDIRRGHPLESEFIRHVHAPEKAAKGFCRLMTDI